jgi:hypothetical protein
MWIWDVTLIWDLGFDLGICMPLDSGENKKEKNKERGSPGLPPTILSKDHQP